MYRSETEPSKQLNHLMHSFTRSKSKKGVPSEKRGVKMINYNGKSF